MNKTFIFIVINIIIYIFIIKKYIKKNNILKKIILNYKDIIPTLLYILIIKYYIYEIFYIPSLSMFPTFKKGDYIIINKIYYFIKNPINNKIILNINKPKYGDIIIFKYPKNNKIFYIKRIIGLPEDIIIYNKRYKNIKIYKKYNNKKNKYYLFNIIKYSKKKKINYILKIKYNNINKQNIIKIKNIKNLKNNSIYKYFFIKQKYEYINNIKHKILSIPNFYFKKNKKIKKKIWKIPKNMYFVMGDFRDNSEDSRYWGYLDKNLIIGKVEYLILNIKNNKNIK